ncbi:MAG: ribosome maturation factor RimM [Sphingomonadaceae bacterium]
MTQDSSVTLAAITGAHGVTGEVRLKLFADRAESLRPHSSFNDGTLTLQNIRPDNKGGAIARFVEITNRNDAEQWRGTALTVPRTALPSLDDGEFYLADLVGLEVVSASGSSVGTVIGVENFGASDIIEIEQAGEPEKQPRRFMVPLTPEAVPQWDGRQITISDAWVEE